MTAAVSPGPSCEICKDSVTVSFLFFFQSVSLQFLENLGRFRQLTTSRSEQDWRAMNFAPPSLQSNLQSKQTWEHMRTPKVGSCWIMKHSHPIILTWLKLLTSGIDWLTRSRGNCLQSESCEPQRPGGFWPEFRRPKVEGQKVPDAIHELWLIWLISITATNSIEF